MNHPRHNELGLNLDEFDVDFEPNGTISELAAELAKDDEASSHYLRARWIAQTISTLRHARYDSGQSQRDIAGALDTKQPAIARLERSDDITLGRIWDYLHACGKAPLPIAVADCNHGSDARQGSDSAERTTTPEDQAADIKPIRERQRRVG